MFGYNGSVALSAIGTLSSLAGTVFSGMTIPILNDMSKFSMTAADAKKLRSYLITAVATLGVVLIMSFMLVSPVMMMSTGSVAFLLAALALTVYALVITEKAYQEYRPLYSSTAKMLRNVMIAATIFGGLVTLAHGSQTAHLIARRRMVKTFMKSVRKSVRSRRSSRRSARRSSRR